MSSLWEALGRPCLAAPLPGPRSLGWRVACAALHRCLLERGVRARLRSAAVLWRALGGGPPRAGADWRQLCELGDVDTLVGALGLRDAVGSVRFATWNVRWLLSPHTERAAAKHAELGRALRGAMWSCCRRRIGRLRLRRSGEAFSVLPRWPTRLLGTARVGGRRAEWRWWSLSRIGSSRSMRWCLAAYWRWSLRSAALTGGRPVFPSTCLRMGAARSLTPSRAWAHLRPQRCTPGVT